MPESTQINTNQVCARTRQRIHHRIKKKLKIILILYFLYEDVFNYSTLRTPFADF